MNGGSHSPDDNNEDAHVDGAALAENDLLGFASSEDGASSSQ